MKKSQIRKFYKYRARVGYNETLMENVHPYCELERIYFTVGILMGVITIEYRPKEGKIKISNRTASDTEVCFLLTGFGGEEE